MYNKRERLNLKKFLVIVPSIVALNWKSEFEKWIRPTVELELLERLYVPDKERKEKLGKMINQWHDGGGVLIMSYDKFRNIVCLSFSPFFSPLVVLFLILLSFFLSSFFFFYIHSLFITDGFHERLCRKSIVFLFAISFSFCLFLFSFFNC